MSRVVLVSGSAQGIGAAIADAFADRGFSVVGADISYAGFNEAAGMIRAHCDVSNRNSVMALFSDVEAAVGPIDILVNNAGVYPMQPFEKITKEEWDRVIATNLSSVFNTCQAAIPNMKNKKWGRIINIVSNTFFMGLPNMAHYIASKGAIIGMSRSLSSEFGEFGLTVNCVAPNFTRTEGTAVVEANAPEVVAQTIASQSIPRVATPKDVLGAILFLAGEEAAFMTGQTLVVDGGTIKY